MTARARRLAVQRRALAHAEAVLLVHDGQREPVELDRVLDQRVRADQQPQLAGAPGAPARRALARGRRSGQQADGRPESRRVLAGEQPVADQRSGCVA